MFPFKRNRNVKMSLNSVYYIYVLEYHMTWLLSEFTWGKKNPFDISGERQNMDLGPANDTLKRMIWVQKHHRLG